MASSGKKLSMAPSAPLSSICNEKRESAYRSHSETAHLRTKMLRVERRLTDWGEMCCNDTGRFT